MKRILRVGERCALSKRKPKYIKLRYISLLAVLTSMCLYAVKQVSAQQAEPAATAAAPIEPLQIGDSIPEAMWHLPLQIVNHPDGRDTIRLDDYRGNTILLDFLTTRCIGCVEALPKLEAASLQFEGKVSVIPVTPEPRDRVAAFLANNSYVKDVEFPFIVEDTVLKMHFPHLYVSHVVWIDSGGMVTAITGSYHVTAHTLQEFQDGNVAGWPFKTESTSFFNAPLVCLTPEANKLVNNANRPLFYSMITGYTEGAGPYIATKQDSLMGIERVSFRNKSVMELYRIAITEKFPKVANIIWDVEDSGKYIISRADITSQTQEEWYRSNTYCYERTIPLGASQEEWAPLMLADLNAFLKLDGRLMSKGGEEFFVLSEKQ